MAKISVMDKVLALLKSKEWVGADELEKMFPEKVEGHRSWGQRLRDLRLPKYGGYDITYKTKEGTKHLTEWHLEQPEPLPTERSQMVAENTLATETKINERQVFEKKEQFCFIG